MLYPNTTNRWIIFGQSLTKTLTKTQAIGQWCSCYWFFFQGGLMLTFFYHQPYNRNCLSCIFINHFVAVSITVTNFLYKLYPILHQFTFLDNPFKQSILLSIRFYIPVSNQCEKGKRKRRKYNQWIKRVSSSQYQQRDEKLVKKKRNITHWLMDCWCDENVAGTYSTPNGIWNF